VAGILHREQNNEQDLLEQKLPELIKSAMTGGAPQINDERIRFIAGLVPVRRETMEGQILWVVGISSVCLGLLVAIGVLMTNMHPALRTLAMSIPAINLVLGPVAALVIIVRRSLNVGK